MSGKPLEAVNLVLFTHDHSDHLSSNETQAIFKATAACVLGEPKVVNELKGKISADKFVSAPVLRYKTRMSWDLQV
jgi:L-ascorbate metabolism protein UlaG (beta-lactamase superfamily)